ncbi:GlsB/YeaQ/YmgE family stress response membrane protein [Altererythrobacter sp.]|uniref:GlsB/YeaQ/YmgE family stress response membrane protein n=1 Tax=Altererythrobacter sp. TaxID=1872480 RepID=UPI003D077822
MSLVLLIVIGSLFGWLASVVERMEHRAGVLTCVGVGVAGAVTAGLIASKGTILGGMSARAILVAMAGSIVFLAAHYFYRRRKADV